jgi:hypothetical protein
MNLNDEPKNVVCSLYEDYSLRVYLCACARARACVTDELCMLFIHKEGTDVH